MSELVEIFSLPELRKMSLFTFYPDSRSQIDDDIIRIGHDHHHIMLDDGSSSLHEHSSGRKKGSVGYSPSSERIKCSQCRKVSQTREGPI